VKEIDMEFIELRNVVKEFRMGDSVLQVLHGITLSVARGEMLALMGSSGSGKTTLMNILGCLDHLTSGEYWLDGQNVSLLSSEERAALRNEKIGFVFQSYNLLPRTNAVENVILPCYYSRHRASAKEERERAEQLLIRLGLKERLHHEPSKLSGGQQQRVAIARALMCRPKLLFADEPTGNLDSHATEEVLELFQQLHTDDGITVVLVTHEADVAAHARRVVRIRDGKIEADGVHP
jgi:ABC-type lipoprotein export system ATPase subunit